MKRSQDKAMEIFYAGDREYFQSPFIQPVSLWKKIKRIINKIIY